MTDQPRDKLARRRTANELTPEFQAVVCDQVATVGDLGVAANVAYTTPGAIRTRANRDPEFAEALAEAWRDFADNVLVPTVKQRAVDGVRRGVYYRGELAKDENGKPVYERHYSDNLLLRLLEVLDKRWRPHQVQEIRPQMGPAALDDLSDEEQRALEAFLAMRAARKNGDPQPPNEAPLPVELLPASDNDRDDRAPPEAP